ncbi:NifB/NifX family molybdenum-iron cluster-binding protein [bacterium]|nr:NifB/NifX family molybdenum-iron cluster-binding protein [bacterium]
MSERVAIPIWQGRVSPVLDTASKLLLCDLDSGQTVGTQTIELDGPDLNERAKLICTLGIRTLLCGAVSRLFHQLLEAHHVQVIPWLGGPVEDILRGYTNGTLEQERYRLPGCGRRLRCRQAGRGRGADTSGGFGQSARRRGGQGRRGNYRKKQE